MKKLAKQVPDEEIGKSLLNDEVVPAHQSLAGSNDHQSSADHQSQKIHCYHWDGKQIEDKY